ncbi:MAG: exonuclease subunit SbcD [Bacteroidota bacterium]|nr:exonuclease subunit SbcD [Bacteroidota bacterium]
MKILHTSDWHLGKRLNDFQRHPEQVEVLNEICEIADYNNVDIIIVAGDIYDNINPPVESQELLYKTLKRLANNGNRLVIAIAGNHDSPDRIESPDTLAKECGIIFIGYPFTVVKPFTLDSGTGVINSDSCYIEVTHPAYDYNLRIITTAYANEYRLGTYLGNTTQENNLRDLLKENWEKVSDKYCNDKGVNILLAHLLMMNEGGEKPEESDDEKSINIGGASEIFTSNIPKNIQYVALGHLHRKQLITSLPCPVVYSGSPLGYSFSEADQKKFVSIVEVEPGKQAKVEYIEIQKGKKLKRICYDDILKASEWLKENRDTTLVELTMQSDNYLTAEERKLLNDSHPNIINLIPIVKSSPLNSENPIKEIDISKDIEDLFIEFFKYKNSGQLPSNELLSLFRELNSEEYKK